MRKEAFLVGEKIYLRALTLDDIQGNYLVWLNDEEVCMANTHHRYPMTVADLTDYITENHRSYKSIVFAIVLKENDQHIGNVTIRDIHPIDHAGEFGIVIGEKSQWGKGIGKDATRLIVDHAFKQFNLNRVYCGTYSNNYGMQKLAESLGFVKEGYRRQAEFKNGQFVDVIEYGILSSEWTY